MLYYCRIKINSDRIGIITSLVYRHILPQTSIHIKLRPHAPLPASPPDLYRILFHSTQSSSTLKIIKRPYKPSKYAFF